jgi:hypothetical protein
MECKEERGERGGVGKADLEGSFVPGALAQELGEQGAGDGQHGQPSICQLSLHQPAESQHPAQFGTRRAPGGGGGGGGACPCLRLSPYLSKHTWELSRSQSLDTHTQPLLT